MVRSRTLLCVVVSDKQFYTEKKKYVTWLRSVGWGVVIWFKGSAAGQASSIFAIWGLFWMNSGSHWQARQKLKLKMRELRICEGFNHLSVRFLSTVTMNFVHFWNMPWKYDVEVPIEIFRDIMLTSTWWYHQTFLLGTLISRFGGIFQKSAQFTFTVKRTLGSKSVNALHCLAIFHRCKIITFGLSKIPCMQRCKRLLLLHPARTNQTLFAESFLLTFLNYMISRKHISKQRKTLMERRMWNGSHKDFCSLY